ncbi:MAG: radical SAM protein [Nanoarchaeota archaeon]|nr:radical SAM protein [Nanoarchaeota archaeon]MBU1321393.1 radical SAM protein [Nanoarchaeota archaeon]MBU1597453.1 radical SAM protein [Nanoarchaeota archaeon]MBU2441360.1 radical SAM protein [Nanoarchaeota archaeon]
MKRKLIEVAFEITYDCNLNCFHCYNKDNLGSKKEMSTEQIIIVLDELAGFGVEKLKIGGGEPLLRPDLMDVYDYAIKKGLETNFSTNGLLVLEKLGELIQHNVKKLQISLDNVGAKHDEFRKHKGLFKIVEQSVMKLNKNSVSINIATTLTSKNQYDLKAVLDFCEEHKIAKWKVMKYIPKDSADPLLLKKEEYKQIITNLLDYKENNRTQTEIIVAREFDLIKVPSDYNDMQCFGGKSFVSMKPNGDITPCSYIDDLVVGNIIEDRIEEIWNNPVLINFSQDYHNPSCIYAQKCRGGCKAITYKLNKQSRCDLYCWVKKE